MMTRKINLNIVIAVLLLCFASCGVMKHQKYNYVTDKDKQVAILYVYYPKLMEYYSEGVMDVVWIKEYVNEDGRKYYKEKHKLKRNYITDYSERMTYLKNGFPGIYHLFTLGKIHLEDVYKSVDDDNEVHIHITYRNL